MSQLGHRSAAAQPTSAPTSAGLAEPRWTPSLTLNLGTDEINSIASAGGFLWVSESWQQGRLFKVDPNSGSYTIVSSGTSGITLQTFEGRLFMAGSAGANPGSISELSATSGAVLRTARVCPGSRNGPINFWIDAQEIAVACQSGDVTVVGTDDLRLIRSTKFADWLTGITRVGDNFWISAYRGTVRVVDRQTLAVINDSLRCPEGWTMWTVGSRVACQGLSQTYIFDSTTRASLSVVPSPASGYGQYFGPNGLLITGYEDGRVGLVDIERGSLAWSRKLSTRGLIGAYYDAQSVWVGERGGILRKYPIGDAPTPTPTPTPTPNPPGRTTLQVAAHAKAKPVAVGKRNILVKSVRSNGRIVSVRARCELHGKPLRKKTSGRLCAVVVKRTTSAQGQVRITAAPTCTRGLRVIASITARSPGLTATTWRRSWGVGQGRVTCRLTGSR